MVTKSMEYRAKRSSTCSVMTSETAEPCKDIADCILKSYFGVSRKLRSGALMYVGDQTMPGQLVDRDHLNQALKESLIL
jgi:hypothetical protein